MDQSNKILIVSRSEGTATQISQAFPGRGEGGLPVETSTFEAMNGHALEMAQSHNVVVFDADPDSDEDIDAIRKMLVDRPEQGFFIALTDEDVSIAKARKLCDAGIDEVLPNTISKGELNGLIAENLEKRRQLSQQISGSSGQEARVISVAQARGGIGATTIAVNLARRLAGESGLIKKSPTAKVALIDLDLQFGNANVFLDLEDNGGFLRLMDMADAPDANYLSGIMQTHSSGVDVLAAPQPIAPLNSVRGEEMAALFDLLKAEYDFIVVDLPHALVEWVEPVVARSSQLVMVMDTTVPSVRQAKRLGDFYREANLGLNIEYVVNHETKPFMRSEAQREAESVLEAKFNHWIPENQKVCRKAVDLGQPICEMGANTDVGKALKKLASAIKEVPASETKTA